MNYRNEGTHHTARRLPFPDHGCWAFATAWRLFYEDDTPERCQREPTPPRRTMRRLRRSLATTST